MGPPFAYRPLASTSRRGAMLDRPLAVLNPAVRRTVRSTAKTRPKPQTVFPASAHPLRPSASSRISVGWRMAVPSGSVHHCKKVQTPAIDRCPSIPATPCLAPSCLGGASQSRPPRQRAPPPVRSPGRLVPGLSPSRPPQVRPPRVPKPAICRKPRSPISPCAAAPPFSPPPPANNPAGRLLDPANPRPQGPNCTKRSCSWPAQRLT